MSAGKSEVATSLDCVGTDACKASVQQYIPTSSHGGMRPILQSDNPDVWVKHSDYAALESLLLDARADLGQCFAIAGADTDGADPSTLWRRAVQAVTDLRRDYDENEDWKSRAERAEALAGEMRQIADSYRTALFAKQAKIDELMWEYCPGEMTKAQRDEWSRHQKPVTDTAIDAVGGRVEG